jgi:phosphoribosylamine--glycine ligase / phosphoribosylformylglycinamidine cyclo-ligase
VKVLLIGSGARENALARKLAESPLLGPDGAKAALFIAPGNPGTAAWGTNVAVEAEDIPGLVAFAESEGIDLVIPGPEAPLAAGIADALALRSKKIGRRIACFGPTKAAAEIESSKAFAKDLMTRLGVPTAVYAVYRDFEYAARAVESVERLPVIKASGLASGKGVFLPDSRREAVGILHELLAEGSLGAAGSEVLLEERLVGEEVSLMAFCDGKRLALMPSAQDHKRLLDGDRGPNTGGMGAYAPAPICPPELAASWSRLILEPVIAGLAAMGRPFVGVLFAGLIVTAEGPKVLEFNCRFGDPETEAVLALLESDLLATILACAEGHLEDARPAWGPGAAASVVMASPGYPDSPRLGIALAGLEPEVASPRAPAGWEAYVLQAGTALEGGRLVSAGGRVLAVTARAPSLEAALGAAYARLEKIDFPGAQYRRDIGTRGLRRIAARIAARVPAQAREAADQRKPRSAYAEAGVDIDAGNEAVRLMSQAVRSTYGPAVLAGIGSFGGLYDASALKAMKSPVLVSSTDGVGTKVRLAAQAGRYASVGADIVNHCVDDILVQGARPLFFLDYIASPKLDPAAVAEAVSGMAAACSASGCALIGGETAEMPGVYREGEFDIAGAIVGVVEREAILPRPDMEAGDLLVGLASSGPHTNGYSLIRRLFADPVTGKVDLGAVYPELSPNGETRGATLGEVLLASHRSYLPALGPILAERPGLIKGLAHITGGGFIENVPRVLPRGLEAVIRPGAWPEPPLYGLIRKKGAMEELELYRVFNMGIGMVVVVAAERVYELRSLLSEESWIIGELGAAQDPQAPARTRIAGLS